MTPVQRLSDELLVARCRSGDAEAWTVLVERFSRYVYAICVRGFRLSPRTTPRTCSRTSSRRSTSGSSRLRDDSAIRPWIAPADPPRCIDRLAPARRGGRRARTSTSPNRSTTPRRLDAALDVRQALQALGEHCREILDRFFARDESYRTIGAALDLPAGTIASRISRCLEKLKTAWKIRTVPTVL